MRKFDYSAFPGALLTPEICNLLSAIHEYRGKQDLYITANPKETHIHLINSGGHDKIF